MIIHLYTVYDQKAEAYLPPFTAQTIGVAIRMFDEMVNTKDHSFNKYPEDFTLFALGEYDDNTAIITLLETPHAIRKAIEVGGQFGLEDAIKERNIREVS